MGVLKIVDNWGENEESAAEQYTYRTLWKDNHYVCSCAEFPSYQTTGETREQATRAMVARVKTALRTLAKGKKEVPSPLGMKRHSGRFVVRLTPELHSNLSFEAEMRGLSMNRLVVMKLSGEQKTSPAAEALQKISRLHELAKAEVLFTPLCPQGASKVRPTHWLVQCSGFQRVLIAQSASELADALRNRGIEITAP